MTLLLDTHAPLWWRDDPRLLSPAARAAIAAGRNTVLVSAAVAWEIAIKRALGKLDVPDDLEAALAANRFLPYINYCDVTSTSSDTSSTLPSTSLYVALKAYKTLALAAGEFSVTAQAL